MKEIAELFVETHSAANKKNWPAFCGDREIYGWFGEMLGFTRGDYGYIGDEELEARVYVQPSMSRPKEASAIGLRVSLPLGHLLCNNYTRYPGRLEQEYPLFMIDGHKHSSQRGHTWESCSLTSLRGEDAETAEAKDVLATISAEYMENVLVPYIKELRALETYDRVMRLAESGKPQILSPDDISDIKKCVLMFDGTCKHAGYLRNKGAMQEDLPPLSDCAEARHYVLRRFRLWETGVYMESKQYATEHKEIDYWNRSRYNNVKCAREIESYIFCCDSHEALLETLAKEYSNERVKVVLATTVLKREQEFGENAKAWAKTILLPTEALDPNREVCGENWCKCSANIIDSVIRTLIWEVA